MKSDNKKERAYKPKTIEKEACIFVEGRFDQIVVELILKNICSEEVRRNVQILELSGKDNLKNVKKMPNFYKLKAVLVILDRDEDYVATLQKIDSFFEKLPKGCQCKLKFISPPDEALGKELEDYVIEAIVKHSEDAKLIRELEKCIYSLVEKKLTSKKKLGKKLLFTYLLLKDKCSYDGLSLNVNQFQSCIETSLDNFKELKAVLKKFISFIEKNFIKK